MQLALGTAQFGLDYGIAGGRRVEAEEARAILHAAAEQGVRVLDTAPAYGTIEENLAALCDGLDFAVISKIPALPDVSPEEAADLALQSARRSRKRLGPALHGLLFHNAEDLKDGRGQHIWHKVSAWAREEGIRLGVSCYDPETAMALHEAFGIALAQIPGSAFDQRIKAVMPAAPAQCEVHMRSAFLQGLLLMPREAAQRKLPQASPLLDRWRQWCAARGTSPMMAALGIVKGFAAVSQVVVGVDGLVQFQGIAKAWRTAVALTDADELSVAAAAVIDPRQWRAA
ncbi:MAG TPA: aldo/keto reductase [Alphaproteobacteria bacterium]|nr:aldo/keto reductase [Alphaproteobacteria bacterium]